MAMEGVRGDRARIVPTRAAANRVGGSGAPEVFLKLRRPSEPFQCRIFEIA
jgi:hypothetical protein